MTGTLSIYSEFICLRLMMPDTLFMSLAGPKSVYLFKICHQQSVCVTLLVDWK